MFNFNLERYCTGYIILDWLFSSVFYVVLRFPFLLRSYRNFYCSLESNVTFLAALNCFIFLQPFHSNVESFFNSVWVGLLKSKLVSFIKIISNYLFRYCFSPIFSLFSWDSTNIKLCFTLSN